MYVRGGMRWVCGPDSFRIHILLLVVMIMMKVITTIMKYIYRVMQICAFHCMHQWILMLLCPALCPSLTSSLYLYVTMSG